jgi:hypothetical protein
MSEKMQIRDRRTVRRFFVDNVILDKYGKKLGPYGIAVYMALCRFADQSTQSCFPSVQTIADRIGAGTTKVREMLRLLEKLGLIETQQRKDSSSIYTLLDPPCPDTPPQREASPPPTRGVAPPQREALPNNPHVNNQQQQQRRAAAAPSRDEENPTKNSDHLDQDVQEAVEALTSAGFQPRSDAQAYARRDPEAARAWAIYARNQNLSGGYIRKRLDAGDPPPEPEKQKADEWAGRVFEW